MGTDSEDTDPVAVVAVHGVAYHAPGATSAAMVELLNSLASASTPETARYEGFQRVALMIPLRRVSTTKLDMIPEADHPVLNRLLKMMEEPSKQFAERLRGSPLGKKMAAQQREDPSRVGIEYMRQLLGNYAGSGTDTFSTSRIIGKRRDTSGSSVRDVHIYEAYWADLARPNNSILGFFLALFQLLLHIGDLSTLSLDSGDGENEQWQWTWLQRLQTYAVRLLQIPIPLLNMILLVAALAVLPSKLPDAITGVAIVVIAALLAAAAVYVVAQKLHTVPSNPAAWLAYYFISALIGAAIGITAIGLFPSEAKVTLAIEWWLLAAAGYAYAITSYNKLRKGVTPIGSILYLIAFAVFIVLYATARGEANQLATAVIWTMQWVMAALRLCWTGLFVLAILAFCLGIWAWRNRPTAAQKSRSLAAIRTSLLGLAMPTLLFLLLALFIWGGVFHWANDSKGLNLNLFDNTVPTLAPGAQWTPWLFFDPAQLAAYVPPSAQALTPNNYMAGFFVWSAGPGLSLALVMTTLAVAVLVLGILPSAVSESYPLRDDPVPPRSSTNATTEYMGRWLSRFLDSTRYIVGFLWCAVFIIIGALDLWDLAQPSNILLHGLNGATYHIVMWIGGISASIALVGLAIKSSSSALGILLDVDTYLRNSPQDATPRAKIAERYVSLLRYVANYQDSKGRHYKRVIIVAHSLGALITNDLLLYLHANQTDPDLGKLGYGPLNGRGSKIPIHLLTMGNPLRQLLNRFFPYLYQWVRETPDGALTPLKNNTSTPSVINTSATPSPESLGVQQWVNAYRSGDYVGRSLWLDEWYKRNADGPMNGLPTEAPLIVADQASEQATRMEVCIGAGAHQHYWDDTAPDVAAILDRLIG